MTAILWLRRDLRLSDHPALRSAVEAGPVLPLFVRDPAFARAGAARTARLEASLAAYDKASGGALVVRRGRPAQVVAAIAAECDARTVYVTADHTPYGRDRDTAVATALAATGVDLVANGSNYAVPPGEILSTAGGAYRVFTPFANRWRDHPVPRPRITPAPRWARGFDTEGLDHTLVALGEQYGPAGEHAAEAQWRTFLDEGMQDYDASRERPDLAGTSQLSAHLRFGEIHPRTLLAALRAHRDGESTGAATFRTELAWREFHADTLWHRPDAAWSDLNDGLVSLSYDDANEAGPLLAAWREGRTGYPFVDAGIRQLLQTGWMHNRLRMVVASLLTKDLHLHWPVGARYFLDHLIDGDLASNNLSWQWVAGTGSDAAPYFRIFNPVRQGVRFDPDGTFVRRWVPELRHLSGRAAHEPWRHPDGYTHGYPERIVDHEAERRECLVRYEQARSTPAQRVNASTSVS